MHKGLIGGLALAVGIIAAPNTAQARSMNTEIQWRCTTAHVIVDGYSYSAGTYCTDFLVESGFYEPVGNDSQYWDNSYAGGGAFLYPVSQKITDWPGNNEPATCSDDEMTRWLHATKDVNKENVARIARGQGWLPVGSLVRVTYDDGGSEVWIVNSQMTQTAIAMTPKGGSKKCSPP